MEECTKETTLMTRSKDMEFSHGLMEEDIRASGKTENNTELESILLQKEKKRKENGKMERESDG